MTNKCIVVSSLRFISTDNIRDIIKFQVEEKEYKCWNTLIRLPTRLIANFNVEMNIKPHLILKLIKIM